MYASKRIGARAAPWLVLALLAGCGAQDEAVQAPGPAAQLRLDKGPELVQNGDFANGLTGWTTWLMNGGAADYAVKNGRAVISIHASATDYSGIQLSTGVGFALEAGKTYRLTFTARGEAPGTLRTSIWENGQDLNGDGFAWSTHRFDEHALTTTMTRYTVDFTMTASNPSAGLCFFMGDLATRVFVDNVSLTEVLVPSLGTELVRNGKFGNELAQWDWYVSEGGQAVFAVATREAVIEVTAPAASSDGVQLRYVGGLPLVAGRSYRVSFRARADAPGPLVTAIWENGNDVDQDGSAWTSYRRLVRQLGTAMADYTFDLTMPRTNLDAGLVFLAGQLTGKVFVDDVSIVEVPEAQPLDLIQNGDFAAGLTGWDSYLMNGGEATYAVEGGEAVVTIAARASDYSGIQLSNNGLPLEAGKAYRLTFRARAENAGWIGTSIWENGHDLDGNGFGWSTYRFDWQEVGPEARAYTVEFVMPITNLDAGVCFFLGELTGRVFLDDVKLVEIEALTPPPPPPPLGTELVRNGAFDAGMTGWHGYVAAGTSGSVEVVNGEVVLTTIVPGAGYGSVQLQSGTLPLHAGKTYRLTFRARSTTWGDMISLVWENGVDADGDGQSGGTYDFQWVSLGLDMATYTYDFTMPVTNTGAGLALLAGTQEGQIFIDDVSLMELPPPTQLIQNGTFDTDLTGWGHWLMNGGDATYAVENGEAVVSIAAAASDYSGIQLSTGGLPLEAGKTYRISFRARAETYGSFATSVNENGHDLDGNGFAWGTHHFDWLWIAPYDQTYSVDFVMPVTNLDAGFVFFLGELTGRVFIDDVSLVELR
jgi:hypothetical protein